MQPRFEQLNDAELAQIQSNIESAEDLAAEFSAGDASSPLDAAILDRTFARWLATEESDSGRINVVLNAIGSAFGQLLVDESGFEWVIATDQYGTDLAVVALPGRGDVLVYPTNMVAKRWESKDTLFMQPLFDFVTQKVRELAAK
jgi:hypothetical protein